MWACQYTLSVSQMPINGAVFDFDGLILDTEWPEADAWERIFGEYGVELPLDFWQHSIGRGADQEVPRPTEILTAAIGRPELHSELDHRHWQLRIQLTEAQDVLPGVIALLDEARDSGISLAVASSSHHHWVDGHLSRIGLLDRFDEIVCADDVARTKPAPDLYLLACERIGCRPADCVAFEDSPAGSEAAKTAGLKTVVAPNRLTEKLEFRFADLKVHSLAETNFRKLSALFS